MKVLDLNMAEVIVTVFSTGGATQIAALAVINARGRILSQEYQTATIP